MESAFLMESVFLEFDLQPNHPRIGPSFASDIIGIYE